MIAGHCKSIHAPIASTVYWIVPEFHLLDSPFQPEPSLLASPQPHDATLNPATNEERNKISSLGVCGKSRLSFLDSSTRLRPLRRNVFFQSDGSSALSTASGDMRICLICTHCSSSPSNTSNSTITGSFVALVDFSLTTSEGLMSSLVPSSQAVLRGEGRSRAGSFGAESIEGTSWPGLKRHG